MTHHPDQAENPIWPFIRASAWLGVGIWTVSFTVISLQLWLQS